MPLQSFQAADLKNKVVLLRTDFNVPMKGKKAADLTRLKESLPTIKELQKAKAKIVILSHFGRPEGKNEPSMSLKPIAKALGKLLHQRVLFAPDSLGETVDSLILKAKPGQVVMLENLRFYKQEEKNDSKFAQQLAKLGDLYINDAFSVSHRAHASISKITEFLPSFAGHLMIKEITALERLLGKVTFPSTVIIGGAKIDTKIGLISSFAGKANHFIFGGGIANTFLAAKGAQLGDSLVEKDQLKTANKISTDLLRSRRNIYLPTDYLIAKKIGTFSFPKTTSTLPLAKPWKILDIGPKSARQFAKIILQSKTIVWNGPLGVTEFRPFRKGTKIIAKAIVQATKKGALSILGGGDTIDALKSIGIKQNQFTHVSTGGGAMLEFLQNGTLPGIEALEKAQN
ncbi:phosphoglycerate kinase [Candidatus Peregrinibacteria bacterium]|nr:phosphoglycerate kinase [Candidatus Peregrinibacteria bacterium]